MNRRTQLLLRGLRALLAAVVFTGCGGEDTPARRAGGEFREGDVMVQHLDTTLCSVIRGVTGSEYTHCGILVNREGKPHVLEAVTPVVRYTPLQDWLNQGWKGYYAHFRPKEISDAKIATAVAEAKKLLGKPYDLQYMLTDERIYCSELIYKAYRRGAGVEIGRQQRLGDFNWKQHEAFIRALAGGELPLERKLVTPVSVATSPHLSLVATTFPQEAK
jgi:hypothetical protein